MYLVWKVQQQLCLQLNWCLILTLINGNFYLKEIKTFLSSRLLGINRAFVNSITHYNLMENQYLV